MPITSAAMTSEPKLAGALPPEGRPYRSALGRFTTGITVITTASAQGPLGFTANSFTSVSLEPALVLFCQKHTAGSYAGFAAAQSLAINILSAEQVRLAQIFADKTDDKFAGIGWQPSPEGGAPLLDGASAQLECRPHTRVAAGDHDVIICAVTGYRDFELPPLGYLGGSFRHAAGAPTAG